ncbi:DUF411 domain-containing protein [Oculatella sp. LEGE 06141]|uniref:DUF411 domain-containing protein n=1 Tax=Oculatella sp. LEGE 06141 TaxID=1828648 RepID=UPI0018830785|nr:DUF411 domain-containing protein [Oculatella sp. LEGE 06141]MBE9182964.1 DUF411 domain-containing protein [Oculatella sp. LEGE 06141]
MNFNIFSSQVRQRIQRWVICLVAIATITLLTPTTSAAADAAITVYRDPSCSCCGGWIDHLASQGFQASNVPTSDMDNLKQQYGVPDEMTSCHTAIIDGYVIEGHVPVDDIKRLLAEQPDVVGIAVPGMPVGTPGMESGDSRDSFTVFSFDQQGHTDVFNQYSF